MSILKITILQGAFLPVPPIIGGAVEKIWYRMGQEFAALGHNVVHIGRSHRDLPRENEVNGVRYIRVPGYDTPSSLIKLKMLDLVYSVRAIKEIPTDADVIITNTFWSPFLLRGKSGKKVYVDVQRVPKGQMKLYTHVGRLRACSPAIFEAITKELAVNFHDLVSYVPNPIPFDVKPSQLKRENIILFVGRLHPEKGVHVLIEAFSIIQREFKNEWKLVIVGPHITRDGGAGDSYYKQLLALAENLNVDFIGPVYNESELKDFYAKSSIFCYPVQQNSGDAAPVAPREAMAYGCVPVVSQLACFNDFIKEEENGLTYNHNSLDQAGDLAATLSSLINNAERLSTLSGRGKFVNQKYAAKEIAKQFIIDFESLVNKQH